jgi:CHAD domain-containing protein
MTVAEGFTAIVQSCLRHFRLNEPLVVKRRDPDALHQARVAMRRLRSAMTLFRPAVADEEFDRLRDELRWFMGQLGDARNLDVYLERDDSKRERKRLLRQRAKAYDQVVDALNSRRFRLLMIDLMAWSALGRWRSGEKAGRPLPDFAERRISLLWLKVCGHDDIRLMKDEERHQLRIEIKKLRYALDFVEALHDDASRRQKQFTRAIEALQEALGNLNDMVTARRFAHATIEEGEDAHPVSDEEMRCIREAQKCLNRLKLTGPYWMKPTSGAAS